MIADIETPAFGYSKKLIIARNTGIFKREVKGRNGEMFSPGVVIMNPAFGLTGREMEILRLIQRGFLSKEIADKLCISIHTVHIHRQNLLRKLGVQNSLEAIRLGQESGLLS